MMTIYGQRVFRINNYNLLETEQISDKYYKRDCQ